MVSSSDKIAPKGRIIDEQQISKDRRKWPNLM